MPSSPLTYTLWFLGVALPLIAAVFMKRRNLDKDYPTFFTYNVFQSIGGVLLFCIAKFSTPEAYFFAYWVNTGIGAGLGFFVIRESFDHMLKPYPGLRDAGMLLFRWAAVLLVVFAVTSYVGGTGTGLARVVREVTVMQRNILLIQSGLLLFVVMTSNYLNLSWRSFPMGIALGMGFFASTDLIASNIFATRGLLFGGRNLGLLMQISWAVSGAAWAFYAIKAEAQRAMERKLVYNPMVDRWNQAAMLIMNSEAAAPSEHTYLSDIERTVETVLAHSTAK
jgi:hypothetical protein